MSNLAVLVLLAAGRGGLGLFVPFFCLHVSTAGRGESRVSLLLYRNLEASSVAGAWVLDG